MEKNSGMRMKSVVGAVMLLSVCVLGGCTTYWYQEGKSFRQAKHDLTVCQTAVRQRSPDREMEAYDGKLLRQCMEEQGYRRVRGNALPAGLMRESSPVFGVPGVAGTIE